VRPDASGGQVALWVKLRGATEPVPAWALSDGQLCYLAIVALARLSPPRSILALDEPELHLHPGLIPRVVSLLEEVARECPVLVATHSRRFLDALSNPAESAVLCELDDDNATVLRRPDPEALERWLETYDGLGSVLDAGFQSQVMTREAEPPKAAE
jgi:predicted ATPase